MGGPGVTKGAHWGTSGDTQTSGLVGAPGGRSRTNPCFAGGVTGQTEPNQAPSDGCEETTSAPPPSPRPLPHQSDAAFPLVAETVIGRRGVHRIEPWHRRVDQYISAMKLAHRAHAAGMTRRGQVRKEALCGLGSHGAFGSFRLGGTDGKELQGEQRGREIEARLQAVLRQLGEKRIREAYEDPDAKLNTGDNLPEICWYLHVCEGKTPTKIAEELRLIADDRHWRGLTRRTIEGWMWSSGLRRPRDFPVTREQGFRELHDAIDAAFSVAGPEPPTEPTEPVEPAEPVEELQGEGVEQGTAAPVGEMRSQRANSDADWARRDAERAKGDAECARHEADQARRTAQEQIRQGLMKELLGLDVALLLLGWVFLQVGLTGGVDNTIDIDATWGRGLSAGVGLLLLGTAVISRLRPRGPTSSAGTLFTVATLLVATLLFATGLTGGIDHTMDVETALGRVAASVFGLLGFASAMAFRAQTRRTAPADPRR